MNGICHLFLLTTSFFFWNTQRFVRVEIGMATDIHIQVIDID